MAVHRNALVLAAGVAALVLSACDLAPDEDGAEAESAEPAVEAQLPPPRPAEGHTPPPTGGVQAIVAALTGAGSQQVAIIDPRGFGQPMTAATLEIPAGWQAQGGIEWQRSDPCVTNQMRIAWAAGPQDGREGFELMHPFSWQVQGRSIPMNPCPVLPLASTQDFLAAVVRQRRPGARLLAYRELPQAAAQAQAQAPAVAPGVQRRFEAGELTIAYQAPGGAEVQERLWTSVSFTAIQNSVMGNAGIVFAHRRLGEPPQAELGARIAGSLQVDAQWLSVVRETGDRSVEQASRNQRQQIDQWHAREMARINAKGAADRAAIRAQTQRDLADIQAQTYANTQATNDRMHRRTMEGIGEYNTYRDTSGNPVRASIHGGNRVLQHPDGSYSSTNDPYARPPGSVELQRVP